MSLFTVMMMMKSIVVSGLTLVDKNRVKLLTFFILFTLQDFFTLFFAAKYARH